MRYGTDAAVSVLRVDSIMYVRARHSRLSFSSTNVLAFVLQHEPTSWRTRRAEAKPVRLHSLHCSDSSLFTNPASCTVTQ